MVIIKMEDCTLERCRQLVADLRANGKAVNEVTYTGLADLTRLDSEADEIHAELAGILVGLLVWNRLEQPLVDFVD